MFAGGTDRTTVTMEWAISELLLHPHCMRKLQEELDSVIGRERLVCESDVPAVPSGAS